MDESLTGALGGDWHREEGGYFLAERQNSTAVGQLWLLYTLAL